MDILSAILIFLGGLTIGSLIGFTFPGSKTDRPSQTKPVKVQISAVLGEIYDQYTQTISRHRLLITLSSTLNEPIELFQWYVLLRPSRIGRDRKVIYRPQNLSSTLPPKEQFMIEVTDLSLFEDADLMAIVVRTNHGEFRLEGRELLRLKQELHEVLED
jgi:hypothetical protein